ncbi:MAG: response regulator [Hyphomicrobiaceae bacterium]|nr:response regulator [Hyphomicrobiaceae bacterium]
MDTAPLALEGRCVLVVEDGWQLAHALKLLLERMGMVVAGPVGTAKEAEALACKCLPEIALVDVNLNGVLAYALMDRLHALGIHIIVITGYEELPLSVEKYCAALHKPFTAAALQEALEAAAAR